MVDGSGKLVVKAGLPAGDGEHRIESRVLAQEFSDGAGQGSRFQEWVGAVDLEVKIGFNLSGIICQDFVHQDFGRTQVFRDVLVERFARQGAVSGSYFFRRRQVGLGHPSYDTRCLYDLRQSFLEIQMG